MDLSPKALRFLIEAVTHYEEHLGRHSEQADLSDHDLADLANDRQFLAALAQDLHNRREELLKGRVSARTGESWAVSRRPSVGAGGTVGRPCHSGPGV